MNNATMTDVLALTDALLEAGWTQGRMVSSRGEYCLIGAIGAAVQELDLERYGETECAVLRLLAVRLLAREQAAIILLASGQAEAQLIYFNDRSRSRTRVRALVQQAAQSLIK